MAAESRHQFESKYLPRPAYSRQDQAQYLSLLVFASAALIIARLLSPSPHGVGTHEQLGLPPCFFLTLTSLPCPSCGLTTSFAHAARLHFYEALLAQPFGLLAFFLTILLIPLTCYLIYRRVPWQRLLQARTTDWVMHTLLALYLLGWGYKLMALKNLF